MFRQPRWPSPIPLLRERFHHSYPAEAEELCQAAEAEPDRPGAEYEYVESPFFNWKSLNPAYTSRHVLRSAAASNGMSSGTFFMI